MPRSPSPPAPAATPAPTGWPPRCSTTTLLDHHRYPAADLVALYHQRWEIETAYLEIKSTILGGRVLRARTPAGVAQEIYALLITYQLLRTAMTDATDSQPGIDPDRASFSIALHAARDQLVLAAGIITDTVITLTSAIGTLILANLIPNRRIRTTHASSNEQSPNTTPTAPPTTPPTKPPSASTSSTSPILDNQPQPLTTRH